MNSDLTSIIVTVVSSGLGAGIVTFCMNFWKAELDFRRAKIEELYAAVHHYTKEIPILVHRIAKGSPVLDQDSLIENVDRINLLIDLYFPRLLPSFNQFKSTVEEFVVRYQDARPDHKEFRDHYLLICMQGKRLKAEVVELSRKGSLSALIEAVQDYDKDSSSPRATVN